ANLRIPDPESRIPGPAELWCKARLIAQWDAERRAQRPLDLMQHIEIGGGLVAAGVLAYWSLPDLFFWQTSSLLGSARAKLWSAHAAWTAASNSAATQRPTDAPDALNPQTENQACT